MSKFFLSYLVLGFTLVLLFTPVELFSQGKDAYRDSNPPKNWDQFKSLGIEVGGDAYMFSLVGELKVLEIKNRFALVPKLGLGYEGGSDQDSLARVLLPYIGINLAFGKPKFHVYIGVSGIIPVKMGQGKNRAQDPYLSFSINPRIRISSHDNLLVGLKYNYFVNGPPNSTGQSWGGITFNYYWPEIINQEYK